MQVRTYLQELKKRLRFLVGYFQCPANGHRFEQGAKPADVLRGAPEDTGTLGGD